MCVWMLLVCIRGHDSPLTHAYICTYATQIKQTGIHRRPFLLLIIIIIGRSRSDDTGQGRAVRVGRGPREAERGREVRFVWTDAQM